MATLVDVPRRRAIADAASLRPSLDGVLSGRALSLERPIYLSPGISSWYARRARAFGALIASLLIATPDAVLPGSRLSTCLAVWWTVNDGVCASRIYHQISAPTSPGRRKQPGSPFGGPLPATHRRRTTNDVGDMDMANDMASCLPPRRFAAAWTKKRTAAD